MHLVPCRWERSGWRYVQKDPSDTQFFQSPNRVNNFGVNGDRKRFASSNQGYTNTSAFGKSIKSRADETTYGRSFIQAQAEKDDTSPWQQQSTPAKRGTSVDA